MKSILPFRLTIILLAVLLLALMLMAGCASPAAPKESTSANSDPSSSQQDGRLSVVTTIFPPYDFVREIAGDKAELTMLLAPGQEMHSFEPSPQDMIRIQNADVFIYVGGESDSWVPGVLDSIDTKDMQIVVMMDAVDAVTEEVVAGMQTEEEEEAGPAYDEHIWNDPRNAALIAAQITQALSKADPANAAFYSSNLKTYQNQLTALDQEFRTMVQQSKRQKIVVADRFAHRYLTEAYQLEYAAAFPGCSEETEPSAATVAYLIDKVRQEQIPAVFYMEFSDQKMARVIQEATGAKTLLLHSIHNVTPKEFQEGVTYLELMERNLTALKEALN